MPSPFPRPAIDRDRLPAESQARLAATAARIRPVGESAGRALESTAADAGHSPESFRRLLSAWGYAKASAVPAYRYDDCLAVARDRAVARRFRADERMGRPHLASDDDMDRAGYRAFLAGLDDDDLGRHLQAYAGNTVAETEPQRRTRAFLYLRLASEEMTWRLACVARVMAAVNSATQAARYGLHAVPP